MINPSDVKVPVHVSRTGNGKTVTYNLPNVFNTMIQQQQKTSTREEGPTYMNELGRTYFISDIITLRWAKEHSARCELFGYVSKKKGM